MTIPKSKSYFELMPWPPKQFNCGKCGFEYDGLVPKHDCGRADATTCDVFIMDFCTHCGETFNQFNGRHTCNPYGTHSRRTGLGEEAYFMRVTGYGRDGQHHIDPYKTQTIAIKDLVTQAISWKKIERQQTPQEIVWEHRKALDAAMYEARASMEDDACDCDCAGCWGEDEKTDDACEIRHCGDDLLGCHEKAWSMPIAEPLPFQVTDLLAQNTWAVGEFRTTVYRTPVNDGEDWEAMQTRKPWYRRTLERLKR